MSSRHRARLAAATTGAVMARTSAEAQNLRQLRAAGCRLLNLPTDVLGPILHHAGCPSRLVCRLFCACYGPLQKGLRLDHISTRRHLLDLVPRPPEFPTYSKLQTLMLILPKPPTTAILSALPAAFPTLRSLDLTAPGSPLPDACSALAPLNPTLTHLALTADLPAICTLASALPSLRSLHLYTVYQGAILSALAGVGSRLTGLQSLQVDDPDTEDFNASIMANLALALPHLTRLSLKGLVDGFHNNPQAADSLASAWLQLADLELYSSFGDAPQGVAAALACRTTLTRLDIHSPGSPEWEQLRTLPRLQELHAHQWSGPPQRWSALAANLAIVTRLVLRGSGFWLDDELAGHLVRMSDTLLSLELHIAMPQRGHLVHLSCLTRLQDLTMHQVDSGWATCKQAASEEQAACGLAAGLSSLRCLRIQDLGQRQVARPLVACLGVHGKLREVQIGKWDPRWPVRLAAVVDTLVRLTVSWWGRFMELPLLISSLKGLERLMYLHLVWHRNSKTSGNDPRGEFGVQQPEWVEGRDPPGDKPLPPEPDATQWSEWDQLVAGSQAAVRGAASSVEQMIWLPPRLRVLVVEKVPQMADRVQAALRAAVRQQGCVLREAALPLEWDNCMGYEEGASLEWLRARGRL